MKILSSRIMTCTLGLALLSQPLTSRAAETGSAPDQAEAVCPIKIGSEIPKLTLQTPEGKAFDLRAAVARKPTLLVFYRGGWCPSATCNWDNYKRLNRSF